MHAQSCYLHLYCDTTQAARISSSQIIQAHSANLFTASGAEAALEAVCKAHDGHAPDAVITCAGAARPMFFVEMTEQDLVQGMECGYWVQAWTAWVSLLVVLQRLCCYYI